MRIMLFALILATTAMPIKATAMITGAVDSFTGILALGNYEGQDDKGNACEIGVYKLDSHDNGLAVIATNKFNETLKVITDENEFYLKIHKKEFIHTEKLKLSIRGNDYKENIVRTVIAGDKKLYVVVSNSIVLSGKRATNVVECVVDL